MKRTSCECSSDQNQALLRRRSLHSPAWMITLVFWIISIIVCTQCVSDGPVKVNTKTVPVQLNDGWVISTPLEVGLDEDSVSKIHEDIMNESKYYNALGFLIVKDSKLVFESYPQNSADRDHVHHIQSATKSITSLLFGKVKLQGLIDSLNTTLYSILPDAYPADSLKRTITLEQLLTMRSGLLIDNSMFAYNMLVEKPSDYLHHLLNLPLYAAPGDSFYYRDCDPQLISYVLQKVTGKTELALAKEILFTPLGISDFYWEPNHEGVTCGAHGLHLRPRDMAKIGQMVLQKGMWNGQQIIDSTWIQESTVARAQTEWEEVIWDYGYYWWILPQYNAFTACGHGGNFILIVPDQNMVIVMVSMPDTNDDYVGTSLKRFLELVRPVLEPMRPNY